MPHGEFLMKQIMPQARFFVEKNAPQTRIFEQNLEGYSILLM